MELKTIALKLGLPETADETAVLAKVTELQAAATENEQLKKDKAGLELTQVTSAVELAIRENRLTEDKKEHFINLGKTIGIDSLKATLDAMSPRARLSKTVNSSSDTTPVSGEAKTYTKLSEVPEEELLKLRKDNPGEYRRLYKSEYGMDCNI
ncbi:phage protease [Muribaculum gordoncarteri]|nr:phage protease [Muribaculum gordoncarteri]